MRGRSYTPSPPRGYGRRGRSPSPRGGRYGGGRSRDLPSRDLPTSLLVRNLRHDCRPDDLRRQFGPFGQLKDIYLPRDYYSGEPRGFGFVQFVDPNDAAEAKYHMDGYVLLGRELTVVFAEENRKKPNQMRQRDRGTGSRGSSRYDRGRSPPPRSSRYSRSPPPARHPRSRSRSHGYDSPPPKRRYSRSPSLPQEKRRDSRERSYTPPRHKYSRTPPMAGSRSRSQSPNAGGRSLSPIPVRGRSRSRSPPVENYARDNNGGGDRSPSQ